MTGRYTPDRDWQYLRLLAGQMAADAQALRDTIPPEDGAQPSAAFGDVLAEFGELIHQYVLFWEGVIPEERLEL